jgi:hypothetical protein
LQVAGFAIRSFSEGIVLILQQSAKVCGKLMNGNRSRQGGIFAPLRCSVLLLKLCKKVFESTAFNRMLQALQSVALAKDCFNSATICEGLRETDER